MHNLTSLFDVFPQETAINFIVLFSNMGSSLFAALLLLTLTVVSAKYSEFDANGSEARVIS